MKNLKIQPLGDRVLVKPEEGEAVTKGGIIIPKSFKEKPQKGKVIRIGPGGGDVKIEVVPGDKILYSKYTGIPMEEEGEEYLLMRYSDVLAKI